MNDEVFSYVVDHDPELVLPYADFSQRTVEVRERVFRKVVERYMTEELWIPHEIGRWLSRLEFPAQTRFVGAYLKSGSPVILGNAADLVGACGLTSLRDELITIAKDSRIHEVARRKTIYALASVNGLSVLDEVQSNATAPEDSIRAAYMYLATQIDPDGHVDLFLRHLAYQGSLIDVTYNAANGLAQVRGKEGLTRLLQAMVDNPRVIHELDRFLDTIMENISRVADSELIDAIADIAFELELSGHPDRTVRDALLKVISLDPDRAIAALHDRLLKHQVQWGLPIAILASVMTTSGLDVFIEDYEQGVLDSWTLTTLLATTLELNPHGERLLAHANERTSNAFADVRPRRIITIEDTAQDAIRELKQILSDGKKDPFRFYLKNEQILRDHIPSQLVTQLSKLAREELNKLDLKSIEWVDVEGDRFTVSPVNTFHRAKDLRKACASLDVELPRDIVVDTFYIGALGGVREAEYLARQLRGHGGLSEAEQSQLKDHIQNKSLSGLVRSDLITLAMELHLDGMEDVYRDIVVDPEESDSIRWKALMALKACESLQAYHYLQNLMSRGPEEFREPVMRELIQRGDIDAFYAYLDEILAPGALPSSPWVHRDDDVITRIGSENAVPGFIQLLKRGYETGEQEPERGDYLRHLAITGLRNIGGLATTAALKQFLTENEYPGLNFLRNTIQDIEQAWLWGQGLPDNEQEIISRIKALSGGK